MNIRKSRLTDLPYHNDLLTCCILTRTVCVCFLIGKEASMIFPRSSFKIWSLRPPSLPFHITFSLQMTLANRNNCSFNKNWQKKVLHLVLLPWWRPLTFRERLLTTVLSPGVSNIVNLPEERDFWGVLKRFGAH